MMKIYDCLRVYLLQGKSGKLNCAECGNYRRRMDEKLNIVEGKYNQDSILFCIYLLCINLH